MLKFGCFIAQLVLVTIEASTNVTDLRNLPFQNSQTVSLSSFKLLHGVSADGVCLSVVGLFSVLSFLRIWSGPEGIFRDSWKATVSYEK